MAVNIDPEVAKRRAAVAGKARAEKYRGDELSAQNRAGGFARGANLSAEELSEQARKAVKAKWERYYNGLPRSLRRPVKLFRVYRDLIESLEDGSTHVCGNCGADIDIRKLTPIKGRR
jgi:hypothetical protein